MINWHSFYNIVIVCQSLQNKKAIIVMKNFIICLIIIVFPLSFASTAQASHLNIQTVEDTSDFADEMTFGASRQAKAQTTATGAFGEVIGASKAGNRMYDIAEAATPEMVRKPKMMDETVNGYMIEITTVYNKPLAPTDELFQKFGNITILQRTPNSYTYLVGTFTTKAGTEQYLNQMIKPRFPEAFATKYKAGEEVKF